MSDKDLVFAPVDWIDDDVGPPVEEGAPVETAALAEEKTGGVGGGKSGGGTGAGGGKGAGGPAPGTGPQKVPVASVLQVIQGTFMDPRTGSSTPLPSHQWEIYHRQNPRIMALGTISDKKGVSRILDTKKFNAPSAEWFLALRPRVGKTQAEVESNMVDIASSGHVWLDLSGPRWVVLPTVSALEKRPLIRIPVWTSLFKASSGGFIDAPPGDFATQGKLTTNELRTMYGKPSKPWVIQVDFKWLGTFLRFDHYHAIDKATKAVPPGLIVESFGIKTGLDGVAKSSAPRRVGGGTAIFPDGTVFVLHERTAADSSDVEFRFTGTPLSRTFVDLAAPAETPDKRVDTEAAATYKDEPKKRYTLPQQFHSFGWDARTSAGIKPWKDLKGHASTKADPVIFHLDDILLCDRSGDAIAKPPAQSRITLFDHLMRRREPDTGANRPQLWKTKIDRNYLDAETAFFTAGSEIDATTRLITFETRFFDVRSLRVDVDNDDKLGKVEAVGARMAKEDDHALVDYLDGCPWLTVTINGSARIQGMFQLRLIDTPLAEETYETKKVHLSHAVIYLPALAVPATQADDATFYDMLLRIERRWDQNHPAQGLPLKNYVVVPRDKALDDGMTVLRFRTIVGPLSSDPGKAMKFNRGAATGAGVNIDFSTNERRVNASNDALSEVTSDAAQDADGVSIANHAMPHEFSHMHGLFDEYPFMGPGTNVTPALATPVLRLQCFRQSPHSGGKAVKPFLTDPDGLLIFNKIPRLRFYWHFVETLNREAAMTAKLPDGPYAMELRHSSYPDGIRYVLPDTNAAVPGSSGTQPWLPILTDTLGLSDIILMRLGDDEASIGAMFDRASSPLPKSQRFDAVLVVRSYLWFDFQGTFTPATGEQPLDPQFKVARRILTELYTEQYRPKFVFYIEADKAQFGTAKPTLERIAVVFQPHVEFGPWRRPAGQPLNTTATPSQDGITAQVWVIVQGASNPPAPAPPANPMLTSPVPAQPLRMSGGDVDLSLLRFALSMGTREQVPGAAPNTWQPIDRIDAADLTPLADKMAVLLKDPVVVGQKTRVVKRL